MWQPVRLGQVVMLGICVCEVCGNVFETIGLYLDCQDGHTDAELAAIDRVRVTEDSEVTVRGSQPPVT